ncbi:hypothetical protein BGW38_003215 [Lunasporangiospora selenospora]|uniref:CSC1/OSCA1-like 7TM region domain-containing protein n=1 Tax=Lunasporangiospora selenospora TaxID=979761 RepID=A0A9P6FRR3_9FUNG|nr:hypothetical protein BGW38_003215 [Lunasporangiospora selenospora]
MPYLHTARITLWSILGPLSWRKVTRPQSRSKQTGTGASSNVSNTSDPSQSDIALPAGSDTFEASFTPAPTQTPRQAFQLRQPPYFKLHHLYPQLVVLFTLSLALLPLAPLLFALWITVLIVLNLSYRYIVLQVVTTNSQSGGLHYLQAVKFLLFPTLACPPLVLAIYLGIRAAWIQSAFSIVLLLVMLALRYVVGKQYAKREEMMLRRVNEAVLQSEHQSSTIEDHPNNLSGTGEARSFPPGVCDPDQEGLRTGHAAEDSVLSLSGTLSKGDEGANETENPEGAPGRRRMKRLLSRPTTIIGQVRTSIIATITPQGSNKASTCSSSSSRPTSVPVFDLARYEKEILGIERDADADEEMDVPTTHSNQELSEPVRLGDPSHPRNHEREKSFTRTSDGRHAGARDATDPEFALCFSSGYFAEDGTGEGVITYPQDLEEPPLSKEQREEKEKEAKYREIVRALRRASSVATRKNAQAKKEAAENLKQQQKQQQGNTRADANPGWKTDLSRDKTLVERHKSGALVKGAKANPPANSPYFRPYTFDTSASVPNMVNMTGSSPGGLGGVGAPSLPTLFIHRESVVAAQEWSRIQGLYLNPALEDAQARVIVWLPSQTEHSFMGQGSAHGLSHSDKLPLGQCRVHTTMISDRSARGSSCQEREKRHGMCTCQLIQEVKKAMADAVALADQEIRDLRIVGLTVWLDSRHVVWGQENEEDGRLGDRVMISTAPTESTGTLSTEVVGMELQRQQRYVGDGLLSWLEDGGAHGETGLGHGAPGIIGGSMGVIMKRPIGSYGRLVGNGEDDDFSQSLGSA